MSKLSYNMLQIDGAPAGLLGLDEVFQVLYEEHCHPDGAETAQRLMQGVHQHNFIPKPAELAYQKALLGKYRLYYHQRAAGKDAAPRDYGRWQGIPREQIPWFPTVSEELCDGCGKCLEVCPKDVYEKTETGKVRVVEPFLCIVECCMCKSACDPQAILMPNRDMLDHYRHGQRQAR